MAPLTKRSKSTAGKKETGPIGGRRLLVPEYHNRRGLHDSLDLAEKPLVNPENNPKTSGEPIAGGESESESYILQAGMVKGDGRSHSAMSKRAFALRIVLGMGSTKLLWGIVSIFSWRVPLNV